MACMLLGQKRYTNRCLLDHVGVLEELGLLEKLSRLKKKQLGALLGTLAKKANGQVKTEHLVPFQY